MDLGVGGRIILKCILRKRWDVVNQLMWLRLGISGEFL
jgi:hypothetical protein